MGKGNSINCRYFISEENYQEKKNKTPFLPAPPTIVINLHIPTLF